MKRQVLHLEKALSLSAGNDSDLDLPLTGIIKSIAIRVNGAYTIGTGVLDAQAAQKIFRQIQVKADGDKVTYSPKGLDHYKLQYYKNRGNTRFNAGTGTYRSFYKLNSGLIFANKDLLPDGYFNSPARHPSLPINALKLILTWATAADFFSTLGTATLDSGTARITVENLLMDKDEVKAFFGANMERYALPKVSAQQFDTLAVNTEVKSVGEIGTDTLLRRALLIALTAGGAEADNIINRFSVVKTKPEEIALITDNWNNAQDADNADSEMGAPLVGVSHIDFGAELSEDGLGYYGQGSNDSLKLKAQIDTTGSVRWLTEEYILHPAARAKQVTPILTL